jgi:hypothetical protein
MAIGVCLGATLDARKRQEETDEENEEKETTDL